MLLLIDGDILVYQALTSSEQEIEWEPDLWTIQSNHADARDQFQASLDSVIQQARNAGFEEYGKWLLALSDTPGNWRKEIYPQYKSNRKSRKPLGYHKFREWVMETKPVVIKPKLEADDCIGILATKPGNDALIWSIDKDFKTIPGKHLTAGGITIIPESTADYWFMYQTLTGDQTDGYPGCPGVGPKKAEAILHKALDGLGSLRFGPSAIPYMWDEVTDAYVKANLTREDALMQARMARILRWTDWDAKNQKVKLWTP